MAAAASPSPPPPAAASPSCGDAFVAVFLDTDLGTRFAMPVGADSVRHLKSMVAVEHAELFPEAGRIVVKSLQVRRKGKFYHLPDTMLVWSAFTRVKGGRFLHVMTASVQCNQDTLATDDGGRLGDG